MATTLTRWISALLFLCSQLPLLADTELEKLEPAITIVSSSEDLALVSSWENFDPQNWSPSDPRLFQIYRYGDGVFVDEATLGSFRLARESMISKDTVAIQTEEATHVFQSKNGVWESQATLPAGSETDNIALDGDTLCIGSLVYRRTAGIWELEADLLPNNWEEEDGFPGSIGLSGNTIAIGATREDGSVPGINASDGMNNDATDSGAVYIFERIDGVWLQTHYIKAEAVSPYRQVGGGGGARIYGPGYTLGLFGKTVDLVGDTLFVGSQTYARKNGDWEVDERIPGGVISILREDLAVLGNVNGGTQADTQELCTRAADGWQIRRSMEMSDAGQWVSLYYNGLFTGGGKLSYPYLLAGNIITRGDPGTGGSPGMYVFSTKLGGGTWLDSTFPDEGRWQSARFRERLASTRKTELIDFDNGWYWGTDGNWLFITKYDYRSGYIYVAAEGTWYYVERNNFGEEPGMHYYNFTTGSWEFRSWDGVRSE